MLVLVMGQALPQGVGIPLNSEEYTVIDRLNIRYGKVLPVFSTAVKPYSRKKTAAYAQAVRNANIQGNARFESDLSRLYLETSEWLEDTVIKSKRPFWRIFYPEPSSFLAVNTRSFILKLNPVLHFQLGGQKEAKELQFVNTRGVELRGYILKRLGFYVYVADNQMRNMDYVKERILQEEAVPGEAFYKEFRTTGVDYFTTQGYIVFNALRHIDISLGHGKHFFGNGIRSLFLSDYAANYFFLKLQTSVWRITYTNLYTEMIATYDRGPDRTLPKKYAVFHHLNYNIVHWLDVGFFESVVYDALELQYLNPVIFYRSVEQGLGSSDNSVIGLDFKANIVRALQLYGQVLLDEFNLSQIRKFNGWWGNKVGLQGGLKYADMFTVSHLDFQFEFNWVRPYTYSHHDSVTTYTHYNQPLAHPLGSNFWETLFLLRYQFIRRFTARALVMYAQKGMSSATSNYGENPLRPYVDAKGRPNYQEYDNTVAQGVKHHITLFDFLLTYEPVHRLFVDFNLVMRKLRSDNPAENQVQFYGGVGLRLNIPYRGWWF
ncbi:MAG: hypothetical protein KatS3mg031_2088 [Chitinophagales bacterium]|nr:MAG: hypothetical protein KatS3mg031_2088 [Chitinophagales bacterium]